MTCVYSFISDYINNFFNTVEFMRNITLGQTLIDHQITDLSLIDKGFLGFRLTHCTGIKVYKKLYVYINTNYFDEFNINNYELVQFNCRLILLEDGSKMINNYFVHPNSNVMSDKGMKYEIKDSNLYFNDVQDIKSFSVPVKNSFIYINKVMSLDDLNLLSSTPRIKHNQLRVSNINLCKIEDSSYFLLNKYLNKLYESLEDLFISNNLYDCNNIEISVFMKHYSFLFDVEKYLELHNQYLNLGHLTLKDSGISLKLYFEENSLRHYLYEKKNKQEFSLNNDLLMNLNNWYASFDCYFLDDFKELS